jgi:hypothetical protein
LKKGWHSVVYSFFKADVKVGYEGKHKYHYLTYAANKCKEKGPSLSYTLKIHSFPIPTMMIKKRFGRI